MSIRRTVPAALAIAFAVAACDPSAEAGPRASFESVDSAGIRVTSNPTAAPIDTLEFELIWEYGHADSHYPFQFVARGVIRDDGSVVVADARGREIVEIEGSGQGHRVLARAGQGPSEIGSARQLVAGSDQLVWVEDVMNGKLMLFQGDAIQTLLTGNDNPTVSEGLMPIGVDATGQLLLTTARYPVNFEEPWLDASLVTFDPTQSRVDTVGTFPMIPNTGDGPVSPFGPYGAVAAAGPFFVTGRTDRPEVTWRSSDGAITQVARWEQAIRYPNETDRMELEAEMMQELKRGNPNRPDEELEALVQRSMSEFSFDESEPARLFDNLYGAETGAVWLAPFTPSRGIPDHYSILSAEGEWVAVVQFDRPFRVTHVTAEFVLGVHVGQFDVQTVAVYRNPLGR